MEEEELPLAPEIRFVEAKEGAPAIYVASCAAPAKRCELRLVVRVGSAHELDGESGYAHYCEHEAFQGTTKYAPGELIDWVRERGAAYGPDVNASTGVFETVYRVSVTHGGGREAALEAVRDGAGVLREWLHGIRMSEADVDAERNVILQEERDKRGVAQRLREAYFDEVFRKQGGCDVYSRRVPIGSRAVVKKATSASLRAWYAKWYTADRAALIVAGDFEAAGVDPGAIVDLIRAVVVPDASDVKNSSSSLGGLVHDGPISAALDRANKPEAYDETSNLWPRLASSEDGAKRKKKKKKKKKKALALLLRDQDLHATTVSLELIEPLVTRNTRAHVVDEVARAVYTSILDGRLDALARAGGGGLKNHHHHHHPPFLSAGVSCAPLATVCRCTALTARCVDVEQALAALVAIRARLDFTDEEWKRAERAWLRKFQRAAREPVLAAAVADECVGHFCRGATLPLAGRDMETGLAVELLTTNKAELRDRVAAIAASMGDHGGARFTTVVVQQPEDAPILDLEALVERCLLQATSSASTTAVAGQDPPPARRVVFKEEEEDKSRTAVAAFWAALLLPKKGTNDFDDDDLDDDAPPRWRCDAMEAIGAVQYTLSNGARVAAKWMSESQSMGASSISLQAFALGGNGEVGRVDGEHEGEEEAALDALAALSVLDDALLESPDSDVAREACRDADVRLNLQPRHSVFRGLGGSCAEGALEPLLALVRARFAAAPTCVPVDDGAALRVVRRRAAVLRDDLRADESAEARFAEGARVALYGDLAQHRAIDPRRLEARVDGPALRDHARAFANPRHFTFVFVGALPDRDRLGHLLQTYLVLDGSTDAGGDDLDDDPWRRQGEGKTAPTDLPLEGLCARLLLDKEDAEDHSSLPVRRRRRRRRHEEEEAEAPFSSPALRPTAVPVVTVRRDSSSVDASPSALGVVAWCSLAKDRSPESTLTTEVACDVLQRRLLSFLRSRTSLVYSVDCSAARTSLSPIITTQVAAACHAANVDAVRDAIRGSVANFVKEDDDDDDDVDMPELRDVVTHRAAAHAPKLLHKSYWLFWILDAYKFRRFSLAANTPTTPTAPEADASWIEAHVAKVSTRLVDELSCITPAHVKDAARRAFDDRARISAQLLPSAARPTVDRSPDHETKGPEPCGVAA